MYSCVVISFFINNYCDFNMHDILLGLYIRMFKIHSSFSFSLFSPLQASCNITLCFSCYHWICECNYCTFSLASHLHPVPSLQEVFIMKTVFTKCTYTMYFRAVSIFKKHIGRYRYENIDISRYRYENIDISQYRYENIWYQPIPVPILI